MKNFFVVEKSQKLNSRKASIIQMGNVAHGPLGFFFGGGVSLFFECDLVFKQKCFVYRRDQERTIIIVCSTVGGIVVLAGALVMFGYCWCQRAKSQEKTAILTAKMTGYDDEVLILLITTLRFRAYKVENYRAMIF